MTTDVIEFIDNEGGYLKWLEDHSTGYVLNTYTSKNRNYMVLHGAWCQLVSDYGKSGKPGRFTGPSYIKICAPDVESLRGWVRQHGRPNGTFTSEECYCLEDGV